MRTVFLSAVVASAIGVLAGCNGSPDEAAVATAVSVEDVVSRPLSADRALAAASVVASLPEQHRPQFDPAMSETSLEGRRGQGLADSYRRQFRAAINLPEQAERWRASGPLSQACAEAGLSTGELALLLMQIGCAHHAGEVGTRLDLGDIRARTKTEIASLCDRFDAAPDLLAKRSIAASLRSSVALDTYLTLLDSVPRSSREVVAANRERLSAVLPRRTAMEIVPARM